MATKYIYAWHVHHDALVETVWPSIDARVAYIKREKPAMEVPLRLYLLRLVKNQQAVTRILNAYHKALGRAGTDWEKNYYKAGLTSQQRVAIQTAYTKARHAATKTRDEKLKALHVKELGKDARFWKPKRGEYAYGTIFGPGWEEKARKAGIK